LVNWQGLGETAAAVRVLGIETPTFQAGGGDALVEAYLRGPDLIAVYRELPDWPIALQARWSGGWAGDRSCGTLAIVELILSARTERLEARPELYVVSRLPLGDLLGVADAGPPVEVAGPDWFLVRPRQGDWSYAEMAHPANLDGSEAVPPADPAGVVVLRHRLFAQRLEKGVLLRTRVRGVFQKSQNDAAVAAAEYWAFASADPPLGT
jgi:hypothetical protein